MKAIPLTNSDRVAVVDDEDYEAMAAFKWRAHVCPLATYAIRSWRENGKTLSAYMHRQILGAPADMEVDHQDNDGLNNRRGNLRLKTKAQNLRRSRPQARGASAFKGVWWWKQKGRWAATIYCNGRKLTLGAYADERLAAFAYNIAAVELFGADGYLNPLPDGLPADECLAIRQRVLDRIAGKQRKNQWA